MTGFNVDVACLVIFVVCIFYTAIGGIKAVMWTDSFQVRCSRYYIMVVVFGDRIYYQYKWVSGYIISTAGVRIYYQYKWV